MAASRRLSVLSSRLFLSKSPSSGFVCLNCRLHASRQVRQHYPSTAPSIASRKYSSLTDKVRRKIWGTDTPPGQEDPYGPSMVDQQGRGSDSNIGRHGQRIEASPSLDKGTESESAGLPSDYVAKTTWDGMERVGYDGWGREEWDKAHPFEGYMNAQKATSGDIVPSVHRALVEVYTLKQEGLPLIMDYHSYDIDDDYPWKLAEQARFGMDDHGEMKVVLEREELRLDILESVRPKEDIGEAGILSGENESLADDSAEDEEGSIRDPEMVPEQKSAPSTIEQETPVSEDSEAQDYEAVLNADSQIVTRENNQIIPADDSWRNITFDDLGIKFAVIKRVMQLTGMRIPDPDIQRITNTKTLVSQLVQEPKPKKLAENLFANEVSGLPNVQISERRFTPIDREKEVGRWKVIEKELTERGLPLTGRDVGATAATVA